MGNIDCCTPHANIHQHTFQNIVNKSNAPNQSLAIPYLDTIKLNTVVQKQIQKLQPMIFKTKPQYNPEKLKPYIYIQEHVIYDGEWKIGLFHGVGKVYFPDSTYFQGTFIHGNAFGEGRYIFSNGDYYEGQIQYNVFKGKGILSIQNGQYIYEGEFDSNLPNGIGIQRDSNSIFQGSFENGEKVNGKLIWGQTKEYQYIGNFRSNLFHGSGSLTSPIGKYTGQFVDGKKEGQGQFIWNHNNFRYKGLYKANMKHGQQGQLYDGEGLLIFKGDWKYNQPKQGKYFINGEQTTIMKEIKDIQQ